MRIHVCVCIYDYASVCVTCVNICVSIHVCEYMCVCVCKYTYVCVHVKYLTLLSLHTTIYGIHFNKVIVNCTSKQYYSTTLYCNHSNVGISFTFICDSIVLRCNTVQYFRSTVHFNHNVHCSEWKYRDSIYKLNNVRYCMWVYV